jgi:hypothetical protein
LTKLSNMGSKSYVSLEMHKPMNHTIDGGGCGCCGRCFGIHGGIPYGIACAPGDGAHGNTYPQEVLPTAAAAASVPRSAESELPTTSRNLHLEATTTLEVVQLLEILSTAP